LRHKAREIDERAQEEILKAVIRELSFDERREHLTLLERVEELMDLAWTRYEENTAARENVRKD
jgi:hypothetical protein